MAENASKFHFKITQKTRTLIILTERNITQITETSHLNIGYTVVIAFAANKLEFITSVKLSLSVDTPLVYNCMSITVRF